MVIMVSNDKVMRSKERLRELIYRTSDFMKILQDYADPEKYLPKQRKPVIDKIHERQKHIQKMVDELKELDN